MVPSVRVLRYELWRWWWLLEKAGTWAEGATHWVAGPGLQKQGFRE